MRSLGGQVTRRTIQGAVLAEDKAVLIALPIGQANLPELLQDFLLAVQAIRYAHNQDVCLLPKIGVMGTYRGASVHEIERFSIIWFLKSMELTEPEMWTPAAVITTTTFTICKTKER